MADVFVSYARVDKPRVEVLAKALEARGFDVWWDHELLAGERYSELIAHHLKVAKAVIVVWSTASIESEWVSDEANVGKDRGVLIPIMFDVVDPPLGYRQYQAERLVGFPDSPESKAAFERLVQALTRLKGQALPRGATASATTQKKGRGLNAGVGVSLVAAVAAAVAWSLWPKGDDTTPPANPPGETVSVGADQRYGLSDADIAGLTPRELADKGLANADFDALEAAAAENDQLSLALLCLAYVYGIKTEQNFEAARGACTRANERGAPLGGYMLSELLRDGRLGAPDIAAADALLARAADAGDPRAQLARARQILASGGNPGAARDLVTKCAARGNVDCRFEEAHMQAAGLGGAADVAAARATYQTLLDPPYFHPGATRELARLHLEGRAGGARDVQTAVDLLKRAEILGDGAASFELGKLAEVGDGLPKDAAAARAYYETAVKNGYAPAQAELDRLNAG